MQKIKQQIKSVPTYVWILALVMIVGIFLRTYNFGQWLRFNADQSRDATVVSDFLLGKESLPLLGPKAGGTEFKLGGMFYHLQIISAAIFGNFPDKMAYPDLAAGIGAIFLVFVLTKRYFSLNIALILAFVASVSAFLVKYSRFAWNPNSGPFYTLLFVLSLLMLADKNAKQKWWIAGAGIAMGIGVQLHTLLLVIMPITLLVYFVYIGKKDWQVWKKALIVLAIAIVLNAAQIYGEMTTGGKNIKAFFGGASSKTSRSTSMLDNLLQASACQIQSDAFIGAGVDSGDSCGSSLITSSYKKAKSIEAKSLWALELLFSIVFTVGGFWFWFKAYQKETDRGKKNMLFLTGAYAAFGFLLLVVLAKDLSLRFYLAIIFVPFMLLGFWIKTILQWGKNYSKYTIGIVAVMIAAIAFSNLKMVKATFNDYSNKKQISGSTKDQITLGETKFLADYILKVAQPKSTVLIEGKQKYLFKYLKSIEYFTKDKKIKVQALSKKTVPTEGQVILSVGNAKNKGKLTTSLAQVYVAKDIQMHGRFSIMQLVNKP